MRRLGLVDLAVDQRVPARRGIGQIHRDLRILDPPGGSGVLELDTDGVAAFFRSPVSSESAPPRVAQRVDDVAAYVVPHGVGVSPNNRENWPAIHANPVSNSASHCSASTLCPAAAARSSAVSTSQQ
jgi:hypothetical protein